MFRPSAAQPDHHWFAPEHGVARTLSTQHDRAEMAWRPVSAHVGSLERQCERTSQSARFLLVNAGMLLIPGLHDVPGHLQCLHHLLLVCWLLLAGPAPPCNSYSLTSLTQARAGLEMGGTWSSCCRSDTSFFSQSILYSVNQLYWRTHQVGSNALVDLVEVCFLVRVWDSNNVIFSSGLLDFDSYQVFSGPLTPLRDLVRLGQISCFAVGLLFQFARVRDLRGRPKTVRTRCSQWGATYYERHPRAAAQSTGTLFGFSVEPTEGRRRLRATLRPPSLRHPCTLSTPAPSPALPPVDTPTTPPPPPSPPRPSLHCLATPLLLQTLLSPLRGGPGRARVA